MMSKKKSALRISVLTLLSALLGVGLHRFASEAIQWNASMFSLFVICASITGIAVEVLWRFIQGQSARKLSNAAGFFSLISLGAMAMFLAMVFDSSMSI